ncbi:MAG: cupredoxin domain-containing protein [Chloroflexota bacterium]|nr:cupredoxin domain-containing protein [Chloroflexota bacterium]
MTKLTSFSLIAVLGIALAGCGGSAAGSAGSSAPAGSAAAAGGGAVVGQKAPGPFTPNGSATVTGGKADIQATDTLKWQPNMLTVTAGEKVTLSIKNAGATAHNFDSPALQVKATDVPAGKTTEVTFTAPSQAGTYQFWCSIPGHAEAGMVGEVIVK